MLWGTRMYRAAYRGEGEKFRCQKPKKLKQATHKQPHHKRKLELRKVPAAHSGLDVSRLLLLFPDIFSITRSGAIHVERLYQCASAPTFPPTPPQPGIPTQQPPYSNLEDGVSAGGSVRCCNVVHLFGRCQRRYVANRLGEKARVGVLS